MQNFHLATAPHLAVCSYCRSALFPAFPHIWLIADGGLPAVPHDRSFVKQGIFKQLFFFCFFTCKVGDKAAFIQLGAFVDKLVKAADSLLDGIIFSFAQTFLFKGDVLESDAAFLEPALGFFCVEAFVFAEDLDVHLMGYVQPNLSSLRPHWMPVRVS